MKRMAISWLAAAVISTPLHAGSFTCAGKVNNLLVYADGSVNARFEWRNDFTYVCNLNQTWNKVTPIICAMWVATLTTAQSKDKRVRSYYSHPDAHACNTIPVGRDSIAPTYIGSALEKPAA